jgi:Lar family restriction alleviation protein
MTQPDLKPCPFCGGDKNTICKTDYDGKDSYAMSCRYPECHGAIFTLGYGYFPTKDEAIAAWNTRAVEPDGWIAEQKLFEAMLNEQVFVIREAALREAAAECQTILETAKLYGIPPMAMGAATCRESILALIGEKK